MKKCGFLIITVFVTASASLPAAADWNPFAIFNNNNNYNNSYGDNYSDSQGYQHNASGTVYVRVDSGANMRSAPFVNGSSVIGVANKNAPLRLIRRDGNWDFVSDGHGHSGWVNANLVSRHRTTASSQPSVVPLATHSSARTASVPTQTQKPASVQSVPTTAPLPAQLQPNMGATPPKTYADGSVFPPVGAPVAPATQEQQKPAQTQPAPPADPPKVTQAPVQPVPAKPPQQQKEHKTEQKPPAGKTSDVLADGEKHCIDHFPAMTVSANETSEKLDILKAIQRTIGGRLENSTYTSTNGLILKFTADDHRGIYIDAPTVNNLHQPASFCIQNGLLTAEGNGVGVIQGKKFSIPLKKATASSGVNLDLSSLGMDNETFTRQ